LGGTNLGKAAFAGAKRVASVTAGLAAGKNRGVNAQGKITGTAENVWSPAIGASGADLNSEVAVREAHPEAGEKGG